MSGSGILEISNTIFTKPSKKIFDMGTTQTFQSSLALERIHYFIAKYCSMVEGLSYDDNEVMSNLQDKYTVLKLMIQHVFDPLNRIIKDTPPLSGPRRYGNFACRDWHDKINEQMANNLHKLVSALVALDSNQFGESINEEALQKSVVELQYYLLNAFGSKERLDFGTGHELSFLAFLGGLDMSGFFTNISGLEILAIFYKYYGLVETLILTYNLEPAGSHGVWGLDDHFHLSYMLGSSQMVKNKKFQGVSPKMVLEDDFLVDDHYMEILYFWNIKFVKKVKRGPFDEHSPILYDIGKNVKLWTKVLKGLTRMYNDEVLNKFPVVQHFWLGDGFYPWKSAQSGEHLKEFEQDLSTTGSSSKTTLSHQQHQQQQKLASYGNSSRPVFGTRQQNPGSMMSSTTVLRQNIGLGNHYGRGYGGLNKMNEENKNDTLINSARRQLHTSRNPMKLENIAFGDETLHSQAETNVITSMPPPTISYPTRNNSHTIVKR